MHSLGVLEENAKAPKSRGILLLDERLVLVHTHEATRAGAIARMRLLRLACRA